MAIKPSLRLTDRGGDVIDLIWRSWKSRHRFTSATWDFLVSYLKNEFFRRRLTNKAYNKRAKDLVKLYLEVLHTFTNFMRMKYKLPEIKGCVQVNGLDM